MYTKFRLQLFAFILKCIVVRLDIESSRRGELVVPRDDRAGQINPRRYESIMTGFNLVRTFRLYTRIIHVHTRWINLNTSVRYR